jgi:uncharacterized protein (TIGR03118 family)
VPRIEILEDRTVPSGYEQINLVGEVPGVAPHTDPNLNGWGMDVAPNGPFAVVDNGVGVASFYDANGKVLPQVVTIPTPPGRPPGPDTTARGVVYNPTSEFVISEDGRSAPAQFLFCTRSGTISGWTPAVDPDHAIILVDNSTEGPSGAWYSGLVIDRNSRGQNVLYAADRANDKVDMFDGAFHFLGSFTDPTVSAYLPTHPGSWQVEDVNGRLFVAFTTSAGPASGPFGGVVDVFDTDGHLLTPNHFAANAPGAGPLDSPWGIVQAPADFGPFSNDILIGNVAGAGYVNAFDPATGAFLGRLTKPDGTPIAIPGLWDMTFGGGTPRTGRTNQLYFDAGPTLAQEYGQGLFGRIIVAGEVGEGNSPDSTAPSVSLSLAPGQTAPQLVGERVTWTATASDGPENPVYQFSVGAEGGPLRVVRDFSPTNTFVWTPMQEGTYRIKVTVKDAFDAAATGSDLETDRVDSRVTGSEAVITPTANPLVALYSVPPGPEGTVHVEFAVASDHPSWQSTNELPSEPGKSTNFLVAGMLPNTTYEMRHMLVHHDEEDVSSPLFFTTGSFSSTLTFPSYTVTQPPGAGSDLGQGMIYHEFAQSSLNLLGNKIPSPLATDLSGRVVWYFDPQQSGLGLTDYGPAATLLPGGTILGFGNDAYSVRRNRDVLREIDLAGDPVRETNIAAVNAQLTALGHEIIYGFSHDVKRFPDGSIVTQGITERVVDINGTPTNYIGNMVIVLDRDFQVKWVWDSFDYLDVNRGPTLGEVDHAGDPVPTAVVPNYPAVDWVLTNTVNYSPADGNLILSIRNQDWVVKIDYQDGEGDGHVIWRLGKGGDFTVNSTDPNPWFSDQHDARYIDDSTLVVFDNGNTRRASNPTAHSRGQVWKLDEQHLTATLVVNADLGNYSDALGAAQRLPNGNFFFTSGRQGKPPWFDQSIEVRPDGSQVYVLQDNSGPEFHSYRVQTLYDGVSDRLADDEGTSCPSDPSERRTRISQPEADGAARPALARTMSDPDAAFFVTAGNSANSFSTQEGFAAPEGSGQSSPNPVIPHHPGDGISLPRLDATQGMSAGDDTPTDGAIRDLWFAQLDPDGALGTL